MTKELRLYFTISGFPKMDFSEGPRLRQGYGGARQGECLSTGRQGKLLMTFTNYHLYVKILARLKNFENQKEGCICS